MWRRALILLIAVSPLAACAEGAPGSSSSTTSSAPSAAGTSQAPSPAGTSQAPVSTATIPTGPAGRACLLTVDQAAQTMKTPVREVRGAAGGQNWDYECLYSSHSKADTQGLSLDELKKLKITDLKILVACGSDAGLGLSSNPPIGDSVPGATESGSGLVAAPVAGGCWLAVQAGAGGDKPRQRTIAIATMQLAFNAWKPG
jgi:hypothetical protein